MLRPLLGRRFVQAGLGLTILLGLAMATGALVRAQDGRAVPAEVVPGGRSLAVPATAPNRGEAAAEPSGLSSLPRPPGPARPPPRPRISQSGGWDGCWPGLAGIALVLAVCGGVAAATRRFLPHAATGTVQVVGRVSLSPKHTVYLIRVGGRELLVGAGPQGAPTL